MTGAILVLNCGSSSVKAAVHAADDRRLHALRVTGLGARPRLENLQGDGAGSARAVGTDAPSSAARDDAPRDVSVADAAAAVRLLLAELRTRGALDDPPLAVAHRVAHGGERFVAPVLVDADVEAAIESLVPLAPLHNPAALAALRAVRAELPGVPQVAVFDTAFHATLPRRAREYALPRALAARHGLRRYGFHGTSHAFVAAEAARALGADLERLRLVTCHLGSGASVAAVEFGRSIETSMGLTPLEGLVMGTRPGDLDPGIVPRLLRAGLTLDELERLLNHESGLVGLAGTADVRQIEARAAAGDDDARLALQVYAHRVRKYVGAYAAVMGGVDAIVFTGGVGERSALVRHRVAQRLEFLGALLDEDRNRDAVVDAARRVAEISEPHSRCRLLVVATDEELALARAARRLLQGGHAVAQPRAVRIAVSARHVHLSRASIDALFGAGHELAVLKPISQPGQYAAVETVALVGPKGRIDGVRVLGPPRSVDQVEISRTDEFALGVDAPVRESGDLDNTPGIRLEGPAGSIVLRHGVICALRHLHMAPADARAFGVENGDRVDVRVDTDGRDLVFGDVLVRVREDFVLEMHVDTDEANAAGLVTGSSGVLEPTAGRAELLRRR